MQPCGRFGEMTLPQREGQCEPSDQGVGNRERRVCEVKVGLNGHGQHVSHASHDSLK